jgi:hypothetical protein
LALVASVMTRAYAEVDISCGDFKKTAEGSWRATSEVALSTDGIKLNVSRGTEFVSGAHFGKLDLYAILERECGHQ